MTDEPGNEALLRRVAALEVQHFDLVDQIRRVGEKAERLAANFDDLEELLDGIVAANASAGAMAIALQQREQELRDQPGTALSVAGADLAAAADGPSGTAASDIPQRDELYAWVAVHIAPLVRKVSTTGEGQGVRWCRQWTEHEDAVTRFSALYLAWHELSQDESATWLSVYLRDHLDPHLAVLTSPVGPFHACSPRKHTDIGEPLGHAPLDATRRSGGNP